jgi:chaperonin GroEL
VIGGGLALLIAASAVREATWSSESIRAGALSFANALAEPSRALSQSVGPNKAELLLAPLGVKSTAGLNVRTGQVEDLLSAGVLDSTKGLRRAVQIGFTYAKEMLVTDVWVAKADVVASGL